MAGRLERKIMRLNDEIAALAAQERQAADEATMHRHLNDDAERDFAVSGHAFDRMDAEDTRGDVARADRVVERIRASRLKLEAKRDRLLARLR